MASFGEVPVLMNEIVGWAIDADMREHGLEKDGVGGYRYDDGMTIWYAPGPDRSGVPGPIRTSPEVPDPGTFEQKFGFLPAERYAEWTRAVRDAFWPYLQMPNPADFTEQVELLVTGAQFLCRSGDRVQGGAVPVNKQLGAIDDAAGALQSFQGQAVAELASKVQQMDAVSSNCCVMVCQVAEAVIGEQAVWFRAREGVADIAEQGVTAMRDAYEGGGDAQAFFKVLGVVLAVAGCLTGGGAAVGLSLASITAGGAAELAGTEEKVPLGAGSARGVLDNIVDALDELNERIVSEEAEVSSLCDLALQPFHDHRGEYLIRGTERKLRDSANEEGDFAAGAEMVEIEYDALEAIANVHLATVRDQLSRAADLVHDGRYASGGWSRETVGMVPEGRRSSVREAAGDAMQLIKLADSDIGEIQQRITIAMGYFRDSDDDVREQMRRHDTFLRDKVEYNIPD